MLIVSDSSPLISLAILDLLNLLDQLFGEVIVPEEVYKEVTQEGKPEFEKLKNYLGGRVRKVKDIRSVNILKCEIDLGEAEAIVLAIEEGIKDVLMDDYKGRSKAKINGLFPIGIIGVLLRAKEKSIITEVKPFLDILIKNKRRISEDLYKHALLLAKEK